jgi:hypothetical protein
MDDRRLLVLRLNRLRKYLPTEAAFLSFLARDR